LYVAPTSKNMVWVGLQFATQPLQDSGEDRK